MVTPSFRPPPSTLVLCGCLTAGPETSHVKAITVYYFRSRPTGREPRCGSVGSVAGCSEGVRQSHGQPQGHPGARRLAAVKCLFLEFSSLQAQTDALCSWLAPPGRPAWFLALRATPAGVLASFPVSRWKSKGGG